MTDAQFEACISDEKAMNALNARWERYVHDDQVNATPTFVINGKVYDKGEMRWPTSTPPSPRRRSEARRRP